MPTIDLPALDGRTALGFLAALGLQRVLVDECGIDARLGFSDSTATAVLHSPLGSTEQIAAQLRDYVATAADDAAIPGIRPGFPLRAGRSADPMRRPRSEFTDLHAEIEAIDPKAAAIWLPSLFTDLAMDRDGRAALTPFCAPAGKQNVRTFFAKPLEAVREQPRHLHDALVRWRRVRDFTGEYLDHRAIRTKADDVIGNPGKGDGVPGATWLATMALPLLRVTGDGRHVTATLWHRPGTHPIMLWPLWRHPRHIEATRILLEHPALTPTDDTGPLTVSTTTWPELDTLAVYAADRQHISGRDTAGVLAPIPVHTTHEPAPNERQHPPANPR